MSELLHPENIKRIPFVGKGMAEDILVRTEFTNKHCAGSADPDVSVVVRSRNNVRQLAALFDDISQQNYFGNVETIVVDTESTDGSKQLARERGAAVLNIAQSNFSYPKALNLGFKAASHPWVFSLVDHSALIHDETFHVAAHWNNDPKVAAAYGTVLPNANATRTERLLSAIGQHGYFLNPANTAHPRLGFMAANALVVRREAWQEVGGFDESYGAGGEDGALGKALIAAGHTVMEDQVMSVHHSHGLGPLQSLAQLRYWTQLGKPLAFNHAQLARFRPDLRS